MPSKPRMLVVLSLRLSEDSTLLQHTTEPLLHWPAPEPELWLGAGALDAAVLVGGAGAGLLGGGGGGGGGGVGVGDGEDGGGVGVSEGGHGAGAASAARAERRSAERASLNCMAIMRSVAGRERRSARCLRRAGERATDGPQRKGRVGACGCDERLGEWAWSDGGI